MDIDFLIGRITPLYNQYKKRRKDISGRDAIEIMWDIGDVLKRFIEENSIAPHALFWKVYGRSEGSKNIVKKSYITREFQNRCHRIRQIFISKGQIQEILPRLKNFTAFREAMPFFDNLKYKLDGKEKERLLALLNSNKRHQSIMGEIHKLQREKIGIKNPRTQRLADLEIEKKTFIDFYNLVFNLLKRDSDYIVAKLKKDKVTYDYIISLSKNTNALSQDGLKFFYFELKETIRKYPWKDYGLIVKNFASQKTAVKQRRFRRVIPPERIVKLADMLYSLSLKVQ